MSRIKSLLEILMLISLIALMIMTVMRGLPVNIGSPGTNDGLRSVDH